VSVCIIISKVTDLTCCKLSLREDVLIRIIDVGECVSWKSFWISVTDRQWFCRSPSRTIAASANLFTMQTANR